MKTETQKIIFTDDRRGYTSQDIVQAIRDLGVKNGETVFVHSQLKFLGKIPPGLTRDEFTQGFIDALIEAVGVNGNVIMPAFSYSYCKGEKYDPLNTLSTVGILTEAFRKKQGVRRSLDPIFSVAAYGPDQYFYTNVGSNCVGQGSIFEKLYLKNAQIIFIGERFDITYMHFVEQTVGVPYRYIKEFSGVTIVNHRKIPSTVQYYVRDLDIDPRYALEKIAQSFDEEGILRQVPLGYSKLRMVSALDAFHKIKERITQDVSFLLTKKISESNPREKHDLKDLDKTTGQEGEEIYQLVKELFPLCRSITGNGVRTSLKTWQRFIPLEIKEVPTGQTVLDWTVPQEWNLRDAYIKDPSGKKIVDLKQNNLHVLGYSTPIHSQIPLKLLKEHLYTMPDRPDDIPYRVSYYAPRWGFCLPHRLLKSLPEGEYEVLIDSSLTDGSLTYGEYLLKGRTKKEVLFSTYVCHPSLANDNLSGPCLTAILAQRLSVYKLKYSYRFLFIPETIGSIVWLSQNEDKIDYIKHGLVVTCLGDCGPSTYKRTKQGNTMIDKIVEKVLVDSEEPYLIRDFWPQGSDERQFCSPGFNLPVGSLMRTPYGCYPEYHSSADNMDFIKPSSLQNSFKKYLKVIDILEHNETYLNTNPKGEPQLGRRGLYGNVGGENQYDKRIEAQAWVLSFSDGAHSLLDIACKSKLKFEFIRDVVPPLVENGLLKIQNS